MSSCGSILSMMLCARAMSKSFTALHFLITRPWNYQEMQDVCCDAEVLCQSYIYVSDPAGNLTLTK
jgi:hypothetical protein